MRALELEVKRRFGFDMWECCTDPALSVTDEQAHGLARDLLGLLRYGIGTGTAPTGPLQVDFDAMRETIAGAKR